MVALGCRGHSSGDIAGVAGRPGHRGTGGTVGRCSGGGGRKGEAGGRGGFLGGRLLLSDGRVCGPEFRLSKAKKNLHFYFYCIFACIRLFHLFRFGSFFCSFCVSAKLPFALQRHFAYLACSPLVALFRVFSVGNSLESNSFAAPLLIIVIYYSSLII